MQSPLQRAGAPKPLLYDQRRIYALKAELLRYRSAYKRLREYVLRINSLLEQREVAIAAFPRAKLSFRSSSDGVIAYPEVDKENASRIVSNQLPCRTSILKDEGSGGSVRVSALSASHLKASEQEDCLENLAAEKKTAGMCTDEAPTASESQGGAEASSNASRTQTQATKQNASGVSLEESETCSVDGSQTQTTDIGASQQISDASVTEQDMLTFAQSHVPRIRSEELTTHQAPMTTSPLAKARVRRHRRQPNPLFSTPNIWIHQEPSANGMEIVTTKKTRIGWSGMPRLLKQTLSRMISGWDVSRARLLALCGASFGAGFISAALTIGRIEPSSSCGRTSTTA